MRVFFGEQSQFLSDSLIKIEERDPWMTYAENHAYFGTSRLLSSSVLSFAFISFPTPFPLLISSSLYFQLEAVQS